jgi:hypothetical protein
MAHVFALFLSEEGDQRGGGGGGAPGGAPGLG